MTRNAPNSALITHNSEFAEGAITDKVQKKTKSLAGKKSGSGEFTIGVKEETAAYQTEMQFNVGELERALYARVVKKCGNRNYWDEWAKDIAKIAQTHITRITTIVENPANTKEIAAFKAFAGGATLAFSHSRIYALLTPCLPSPVFVHFC